MIMCFNKEKKSCSQQPLFLSVNQPRDVLFLMVNQPIRSTPTYSKHKTITFGLAFMKKSIAYHKYIYINCNV